MAVKLDKRGRLALSEKQIEQQIVDLLRIHGWYVLRTNQASGYMVSDDDRSRPGAKARMVQGSLEPGMPDLLAIKRFRSLAVCNVWGLAQVLWIEVKAPTGRLSREQTPWHQAALMRGESVLVARSVHEVARYIGVRL